MRLKFSVFLVGKNTWKTDRTFVFKVGTSVDAGAIIGDIPNDAMMNINLGAVLDND